MEYIDLRKFSDEDYKEAVSDMMATDGWQLFLSELFAMSENMNNIQDIDAMEKLHYVRGQLDMIGFVLNYESIMDQEELPDEGA
jgi:hypothetical protein